MILLNGAIPLPLAIIIKDFYGVLKVDSKVFIRIVLGMDLK